MFDNLNTNKQQNQGGNGNENVKKATQNQSGIGFNQNNQTVPQPQKSMDSKNDNIATPQKLNKQQMAEDIFAEVDKEVGEQVIESLNHNKERPESLQPKNIATINEAESAVAASLQENKGNVLKKIIFVLLGILVLGGIVYGGFWSYNNLYKQSDIVVEEEFLPAQDDAIKKTETSPNNKNINNTANNIKDNNSQQPNISHKPKIEIQDTDQDGLSDQEERALGTNVYNIDSDNDGLFDREEVKTYKTDPLNPDTDGDGYKDGEEVKNGYNPLGKGKLYEINK